MTCQTFVKHNLKILFKTIATGEGDWIPPPRPRRRSGCRANRYGRAQMEQGRSEQRGSGSRVREEALGWVSRVEPSR